jgi:hypothetical protein
VDGVWRGKFEVGIVEEIMDNVGEIMGNVGEIVG